MELTLDQALQKGIEAHKAGQVQEADRLYTAIIKAQPKHPDANHNMGVLAVGVGKVQEALPFFKIALEANPNTAQFWLSYIDALIKLEKLADAKAMLDQAKGNGAKGDGFDELEQKLNVANTENTQDNAAIETLETNQSSTLDTTIQLREAGQFNQAIDLLKDEIDRFPQDADLLALLSHCYLLNDEVDLAKLHLNKAKKITPESASVGWNTARIKLKEQNPLEALNVARDTSQKFPDDVEGMGVLGACLRANNEVVESLEVLNRAVELNPDYAEALINRGLIRLSQENKPEALADIELAHRLKPHIRQIWDLVVRLKVEAQEYSDAIVLLIDMIEIDPEDEERLVTLALCYQHLKDFEASEEAYNKALAIKPDYAKAHMNLGSALKEQGKLEKAIGAYNKALAIKPDYAEAYNNLGNVLKDQGKLEEAIEAYNKALAIKPDYAQAYNNMGATLKDQGKLEEAIEAYNKALAIKPDYAEVYYNMGATLQEQGKLDQAIEAYNKVLAIKPDYAEAYNNMGITLQEQGKLEEAIEAYNKALEIKPDYAEAYNNIGITLKEQGKLEEAIEVFDKALAIKPDDAKTRGNLAILLFESNQFPKAAKLFAMDSSSKNQSYLLKCFYEQGEKEKVSKQLDYLIEKGENNAVIGSFLSRSKVSFGIKKDNPFCNKPLNYVSEIDLNKECDFKKIFVENAANVLSNDEVKHKSQGLLTNGIQTAGNIFTQVGSVTDQWQNIIRSQLIKYKEHFCESDEGFIRDWPANYNIDGWLVSMKSGGELSAHIHDRGWITGSIYINVPPKSKKDSGNLVVTTHDSKHGKSKTKDITSIDVITGSLCLFPSSLLHYTIPFESDEDRVVLAFDIIPK